MWHVARFHSSAGPALKHLPVPLSHTSQLQVAAVDPTDSNSTDAGLQTAASGPNSDPSASSATLVKNEDGETDDGQV